MESTTTTAATTATTTTAKTTDEAASNGGDHHDEATTTKRAKTDVPMKDVLNPSILSQSLSEQQTQYLHSEPYRHGCFPNLFQENFLQSVITEIKDYSTVNFKESDLFKVYQSIDMANISISDASNQERIPHVLQLRQVLYSQEFRTWMEQVNGLDAGTLSETPVDCACNCHMTSCHLLCHDDVIGTRKISYILYLTEPDWKATEGGALELYDSQTVTTADDDDADQKGRRIPDPIPSKSLLPWFNHMAFFVVEPGVSFHAVQEVLGDRPRLSLQGWYHTSKEPANIEHATLSRLKSYQSPQVSQEEDTEGTFAPMVYPDQEKQESMAAARANNNGEATLSVGDRDFLRNYLDETYLKDDAIADIRKRFEDDSSVQLQNILNDKWVQILQTAIQTQETSEPVLTDPTHADYYQLGVEDKWSTVGPAHKQRFLEYQAPPADDNNSMDTATTVGQALAQLKLELLQSGAFGRFLGIVSGLDCPTSYRGRVRRFRKGRDYTVAHYGLLTETPVLDATLCFVRTNEEKRSEEEEMWESGDCGGFECYIAADDENSDGDDEGENNDKSGPADEYNPEDDTELLSVHASNNTLSLVFRDPGTMRFIKYVSAQAPSSRWDIAMEYEVPEDEDDAEEGEKATKTNKE